MLEIYEQKLQDWIEQVLSSGDDDAVFASGYLQGHFAVVLSELEPHAQSNELALLLEQHMQICLQQARKELEDKDYALVLKAWQSLKQQLPD